MPALKITYCSPLQYFTGGSEFCGIDYTERWLVVPKGKVHEIMQQVSAVYGSENRLEFSVHEIDDMPDLKMVPKKRKVE